MKFRKSTWLDTRTKTPAFGIEVRPQPKDHWFNCHENGNPLIYATEAERDAKLSELSATPITSKTT
jgi:hypothetical protein